MSTRDLTSERILVLAPGKPAPERIQAVLARKRLPCQPCAAMAELAAELAKGAGTAVVSEEALTPEAMKGLLEVLAQQEPWADFPLIVLFHRIAKSADAQLRMLDLLEPLGNVTVLQRPISAIALASAVQAALRARRRQYEVRKLLEERDQAIQHRDRFLSLLAHEVRNPLSVIRNASCILDNVNTKSHLAMEQRASIVRQTARLALLIDNTLDLFQILAGRVRLERQPVDLVGMAAQCLRDVRGIADVRNRQLALHSAVSTLPVEGDAQRLRQMITHLLHNALETAPEGRRIELHLTSEGNDAVLRLRGGLPAPGEKLEELFELMPATDHTVDHSLHLGLALAGNLVKLHGGSATAATPDGELEVTLRLPRQPAEVPAPAAADGIAPTPASRQVLLVEDNDDGRETLRILLQLWGHRVDAAANGTQGVRKALDHHPEVGLIDIGLPDVDGYQVARQLRAALGKSVYLVAMTGYGQPHDREHALAAGFDAHLVKPVLPGTLQSILAELGASHLSESPKV